MTTIGATVSVISDFLSKVQSIHAKGRALGIEDVRHYQRILKILAETDRIMRTITMELEP